MHFAISYNNYQKIQNNRYRTKEMLFVANSKERESDRNRKGRVKINTKLCCYVSSDIIPFKFKFLRFNLI